MTAPEIGPLSTDALVRLNLRVRVPSTLATVAPPAGKSSPNAGGFTPPVGKFSPPAGEFAPLTGIVQSGWSD
eukprot:683797-Prorocentrum_minimum.AAC.1